VEKGWGSFNWSSYRRNTLEAGICHNFDFRTTGLLREFFLEYMTLDYEHIKEFGVDVHPLGDVPNEVIDYATNHFFGQMFLDRLFDPHFDRDF